MKLTLYRENLLPESAKKNCSQIGYNDFPKPLQDAIRIVGMNGGSSIFWENDWSDYNKILFAPESEKAHHDQLPRD